MKKSVLFLIIALTGSTIQMYSMEQTNDPYELAGLASQAKSKEEYDKIRAKYFEATKDWPLTRAVPPLRSWNSIQADRAERAAHETLP